MKSGPVPEAANPSASETSRRLAERARSSITSDLRVWEPPVPLDQRADLPDFPLDALPNWIAAFVEAEAIATQTPPDMPGLFVLGAIAAMVQGRAQVEAAPGWTEELAIYGVVLAAPGERKSATHRDVFDPVGELEKALIDESRGAIAEAHAFKDVLEKRLETRKKTLAAKPDPEIEQQVRELVEKLSNLSPPVAPRISCDDVTPEALASLLADQGGSISLLSAEGGIFDQIAGRYGNGQPNIEVFLKGHAGDQLRVDRKGRKPEIINRPVLTICVAAQPHVIVKASQTAALGQRGLFDRFAYSLPTSRVGHRIIDPPAVPARVKNEYRLQMLELGRSMRALELVTLRTSVDAREALNEWRTELEPRRRPDGALGHAQGLASKLDGLAVRLSGLLHLADTLRSGFERPISGVTMRNALRLADYFLAHGLAVYEMIGADPALEGTRRLHAWVKKTGKSSFSKRDAHAGNRSYFKRADELDAALTLLERHGWIRGQELRETKPKGGRPSSPIFDVHPLLLGTETTIDAQPPSGGTFVGSVSIAPTRQDLLSSPPSLSQKQPPEGVDGDQPGTHNLSSETFGEPDPQPPRTDDELPA